jgi:hypothetical protein
MPFQQQLHTEIFCFPESHCYISTSNFINSFYEIVPSNSRSCECINHPSRGHQLWLDCMGEQLEPCGWLLLPDSSKFLHSSSATHMSAAVVPGNDPAGSKSPAAPELQWNSCNWWLHCRSSDIWQKVKKKIIIYPMLSVAYSVHPYSSWKQIISGN